MFENLFGILYLFENEERKASLLACWCRAISSLSHRARAIGVTSNFRRIAIPRFRSLSAKTCRYLRIKMQCPVKMLFGCELKCTIKPMLEIIPKSNMSLYQLCTIYNVSFDLAPRAAFWVLLEYRKQQKSHQQCHRCSVIDLIQCTFAIIRGCVQMNSL